MRQELGQGAETLLLHCTLNRIPQLMEGVLKRPAPKRHMDPQVRGCAGDPHRNPVHDPAWHSMVLGQGFGARLERLGAEGRGQAPVEARPRGVGGRVGHRRPARQGRGAQVALMSDEQLQTNKC